MQPFLKMIGSKRRLAPSILPFLPPTIRRYHEPFLGAGALFGAARPALDFTLRPMLADVNADLISAFWAVGHDIDRLVSQLHGYAQRYASEGGDLYKRERVAWNKGERFPARLMFLSGSCFNAVWRVNSAGHMNTPWGQRETFRVDEPLLRAWSPVLRHADLRAGDYRSTVQADRGDVVYCDSPYLGTFSGYSTPPFTRDDHVALIVWCALLHARGVHVIYSNSLAAEPLVEALWPAAFRHRLTTRYLVSADGQRRTPVEELLVVGVLS